MVSRSHVPKVQTLVITYSQQHKNVEMFLTSARNYAT